jgi:Uncharacterized protein conserved in bacteria (DUF2059)
MASRKQKFKQVIGPAVFCAALMTGPHQPAFGEARLVTDQSTVADAEMADFMRLADTLQLRPLLQIMSQEGMTGAQDIKLSFLGDQKAQAWADAVARRYDPQVMFDQIIDGLRQELGQDRATLQASEVFFASDLGKRIITLETEARRALLAEGASAAAEAGYYGMVEKADPRVDQIKRFVTANDLIETNVMSSLNGDLAFMTGLARGGLMTDFNEADRLAQVWAGEDEARKSTAQWIYPYLALAYQPLSDAELEAYIDFSTTPAGKRLNFALFKAFDAMTVATLAELGHTMGQSVMGQDI